MAKQKSFSATQTKEKATVIEFNPFEIHKKIRKPLPPPGRTHKDKSKYSRKQKYKVNFEF